MRRETPGVPRAPAVMAQERGHVPPRRRRGRGQGAQGRWHAAGFPSGSHAMPRRGGDGMRALVLVVATVREDADRTRILGTASVFQVQRLDGLHHEVRRRALRQRLIPARALALPRDGTKRHHQVMEDPHERGPLLTNDPALAMRARLGVCWRQTGALLERTLHDHRPLPGQLWPLVPGLGHVRGVVLGEALQRRDGDSAVGLQHLRAWRGVPSGTPGGFCEGLLRGHDHQKQPSPGADPLKTATDPETPRAPSLHRASRHGAASLEPRDRERDADERGPKARCPSALAHDALGARQGGAAL